MRLAAMGGARRRLLGVGLVGLALAVGAVYARAGQPPQALDLTPLSSLGGPAEGLVVANGVGYVRRGRSLVSVSLRSPDSPLQVGSITMPERIERIVASGTNVYAVLSSGYLTVVDVTDPRHPRLGGSVKLPDTTYIADVAASEGRVYVGSQVAGISIVDVRNPDAPVEVLGGLGVEVGIRAIAVSGDFLLVIPGGELGFKVWDMTAAPPALVGESGEPRGARDIAVQGGNVYVLDVFKGLSIFSLEDPTEPRLAGSTAVRPDANDGMAMGQGYVFVASSDVTSRHLGGIVVVDVRNSAEPKEAAEVPVAAKGAILGQLTWSDGFLYEASSGTMRVIDVVDPRAPKLRGALRMLERSAGLAVSGNLAFLAAGSAGLRVVDVADPSSPEEIGLADWLGVSTGVAYARGYVYVTSGVITSTLHIVDVADPRQPRQVRQLSLPGLASSIQVQANRLFVQVDSGDIGGGTPRLLVFSLDQPSRPVSEFDVSGVEVFAVNWPLVYAGDDTVVKVINLDNGPDVWRQLTLGGTSGITAMATGDGGIYALHGSQLSRLRIDDSQELVADWTVPVGPNGRYLTADADFAYVGYSMRPGGRLAVFETHEELSARAQFDMSVAQVWPQGRYVLAAGEPALVVLPRPDAPLVPSETPAPPPTVTGATPTPPGSRIFLPSLTSGEMAALTPDGSLAHVTHDLPYQAAELLAGVSQISQI